MDPQVLDDAEKLARQKAIIRYLESSNGQNLNHAMLTSGPNAGQTAGGAYGIVPNSLKDFAKQSMNRNIGVDPDILVEMDKPADEVTKQLNTRPDLDDKAAEMALRLINAKTGGDEAKTAYAWRTGHNQSPEKLEQGAAEHPYVRAYNQQREKYLSAQPSEQTVQTGDNTQYDNIQKLLNLLGY
jgi:hypothetical protein